ncbi:MAG: tetratricopeptide repeat protein [Planctomycetales bacterium]
MPTRINGIGTAYIGRGNRQASDGVCESCHRATVLENYETRLWFTVLFIPVIPLTRQQILNYCPICTRHQAVPFAEWEQLRQAAIDDSAGKLAENKDDPQAAIEMHGTLAAFHQREQADKLAGILREKFAQNAPVQFYLGGWFEKVGKGVAADECFERAWKLDPTNPVMQRAVAIGRIERGELDEARTMLAAFVPPSPAFEPQLFIMLAQAYQTAGRHAEALELQHMLLTASPGLASAKAFRKQVRASEKALGVERSAVPQDPLYRSPVLLGATVAVMLLALAIGWNHYVKTHQSVHVVNGLRAPISVQVDDGPTVEINGPGRTLLTLAEGRHRAKLVSPAELGEPFEFELRADWLDRYVSQPAFVLDPSRSAVVAWESVNYRVGPAGNETPRYRWHVGQPWTTYAHVDYLFQEFPDKLQMKKSTQVVTKTRVDTLEAHPASAILHVAADSKELLSDVLPYAEAHLLASPDEDFLLSVYYGIGVLKLNQADRCREFLAAGLSVRPVRVEWHRIYQGVCGFQDRDPQLLEEYDQYVAADPNNSMLLYLRGRIDPTAEGSQEYYRRAQQADPGNPYPWFSRGYRLRNEGQLTQARQSMAEAVRLHPDNAGFRHGFTDIRFALGEFTELAAEAREGLQRAPGNLSDELLLLEALTAAGRAAEADAAQKDFEKSAAQAYGPFDSSGPEAKLYLLYFRGEFEKLLRESSQRNGGPPFNPLQIAARIELGQIDGLAISDQVLGMSRPNLDLLLSLVWQGRGDASRAEDARSRALSGLQQGDKENRRVAALLQAAPELPPGALEQISMESSVKALVLIALADLCPEQRGEFLSLARTLNYRRGFPYHALQRLLTQREAPDAP